MGWGSAFTSAWNKASDAVQQKVAHVATTAKQVVNQVVGKAQNVAQNVAQQAQKAASFISQQTAKAVSNVKQATKTISNQVAKAVQTAKKNVPKIAQSVRQKLDNAKQKALLKAKTIKDVFNKVKNNFSPQKILKKAIEVCPKAVLSMQKAITKLGEAGAKTVTQIGKKAVKDISQLGKEAEKTVSQLGKKVEVAISEAKAKEKKIEDKFNYGVNLVKYVVSDGISKAKAKAIADTHTLLKAINDGFESRFPPGYQGIDIKQVPLDADFSTVKAVVVQGDGINIFGHELLFVPKKGGESEDGYYFQVASIYEPPKMMDSKGFSGYLQDHGKTVLNQYPVKIPNPEDARQTLGGLLGKDWSWRVVNNNCVSFVETVVQGGGSQAGLYLNLPKLERFDETPAKERLDEAASKALKTVADSAAAATKGVEKAKVELSRDLESLKKRFSPF